MLLLILLIVILEGVLLIDIALDLRVQGGGTWPIGCAALLNNCQKPILPYHKRRMVVPTALPFMLYRWTSIRRFAVRSAMSTPVPVGTSPTVSLLEH